MEALALSVSELTGRIKRLIDSDGALASVAVRGELSNYKVYPSGHHYFTLKDAESSLRCVMFKTSAGRLSFKPESGMGVVATGRVTVYPRDGAYQLYCTELLPEGLGDLYAAFEKLKEKLRREGLFEPEHKKPLPRFPERIAVITSSAGAAVRDIIRVLKARWPMSKVLLLPVRVQGAEAPPELVGALRYANRFDLADLIIIGRGGGSIEDLWAFNDERVARAIFESEIPVISAVGHEPDVTISDYVADLRAATPSNGAELAVPDCEEMAQLVSSLGGRLFRAQEKKLAALSSRLEFCASRRALREPTAYIDGKRQEVDYLYERLGSRLERAVAGKRQSYVRLAAKLDALSPLKVLARGYAIATDGSGRTITDALEAEIGSTLSLALRRGSLGCLVTGRTEDKDGEG
ncbi:MAG: exodeoxyribonuclease VII large subunit [Oscillospiraceae bacterium]|jgi:exodeoxyribonuclease VII large subunit|nr:exodeoxyribonuclease VII large subunit [Oscillospiraceae bacterium]